MHHLLKPIATGALLLSLSPAFAQVTCTNGNPLNQTQLSNLLSGRTVCARLGNDRWQEWHAAGGALWDYKRGPNDRVDPSEQVGTWTISGTGSNAIVTHTYGGTAYGWAVCANPGSTYDFVPVSGGGSRVNGATVLPASAAPVACP